MKYFAAIPVRPDWILSNGALHLLVLVDEETLRGALLLIDREREIAKLKHELDTLREKLDGMRAADAAAAAESHGQ